MRDNQKGSYTRGATDEDEDENYKMGLTGCGCFLKYSMFFFNAIILIAGCGLLGFGVYSRTNDSWVSRFSAILGSYLLSTLSVLLISAGGIVILLSFLGCCGAIKEVRCMLALFFALLLLMLVGLLIAGILAYVYKDEIGDRVLTELYTSLNTSYGAMGQSSITEAWNKLQELFSCCGVYGDINSTTSWAYYRNTVWYRNQTPNDFREFVPHTCCKSYMGDNRTRCTGASPSYHHLIPARLPPVYPSMENDLLFTEGCYSAFVNFVSSNIKILGGVAVGVALMMMLAMTFSICLCRRIKDDYFFD